MSLALATSLDAAHAVVDALRSAGIRTATEPADVTTPCAYVGVESVDNEQAVLAGGCLTGLGVAWLPIRGMYELFADAAALDAVRAALDPVVVAPLHFARSSLLIGDQSWPCYFAIAFV